MSVVVSGLLSRAKAFWPMLAGIICARTALIVACYGSYASTDDGIFTDGSMFVTCALFIVTLLIFSRSRRELGATAVQWIMVGSITVAAGASMALSLLDSADQTLAATAFALSIASTLALSLCMFYWLRCLRGTDEVTAALFVFSAFFISVGIVYLLSFLPTRAQNIIGMALIVAQFASLGPAGLRAEHPTERPHRRARTFFTFARSNIQDSRFLAACAVGMALLGFVDGFLRGYPDGLPISFTWGSRLAYALCSMLICALLMLLVVRRRERVMTVDAFITMALLASLSLVLFGAFPYRWEIGAVAVNTLNIVICAYCWYVIIAFTSFGTRDPYVYAMGGWVICFGSRSLARMLLYFTYPLAGNDLLINSLLGALVLISTQVVLVQFMHAERGESSAENDRLEAENERVTRQAEADAAESAAALAEAEQTLQSVVFNAAKREASAQQTASEALKAAEARQCIRCNEECAAIREQLLQIDSSSISLASAPSSSPPRRRCHRLSPLQPRPPWSHPLSLSRSPWASCPIPCAATLSAWASTSCSPAARWTCSPFTRWVTHRRRWPKSCSSPPPPPTATSSASTASAACTRARKSSSTSILTETEAERWKRNAPKPRIVPASRSRRNARAPHREPLSTCAGSAFSAPSWPPSASASSPSATKTPA